MINLPVIFTLVFLFSISAFSECFERHYSNEHLNKNSGQEVRSATVSFDFEHRMKSGTSNDSPEYESLYLFQVQVQLNQKKKNNVVEIKGTCKEQLSRVIDQFNYYSDSSQTKDLELSCPISSGLSSSLKGQKITFETRSRSPQKLFIKLPKNARFKDVSLQNS